MQNKQFNLSLIIIRKFKLLALGLSFLMIIFFYFVLIKPQRELIASTEQNDLQPLIDQKNSKMQSAEDLKNRTKDYAIIKDLRLQSLEQILPDISSKDDLYIVLEQIILERGWAIKNLKSDEPVDILNYGTDLSKDFSSIELFVKAVPISITVDDGNGNLGYEDIKEIISILYSQKRIFNINSLEIGEKKQSAGGAAKNKESGLEFKFDAFFVDNEPEAIEPETGDLDPALLE